MANRFQEAGHCDVPCHGDIPDLSCDHGHWDCLSSVGDAASCFDFPCDGVSWRGSNRKSQKHKDASIDAQRDARQRGGHETA